LAIGGLSIVEIYPQEVRMLESIEGKPPIFKPLQWTTSGGQTFSRQTSGDQTFNRQTSSDQTPHIGFI